MDKIPWPVRAFVWYLRRPWIGYLLLFLLATYWGLAPRTGEAVLFGVLLLPWMALLLVVLNLPVVGGLARRLRLPAPVSRNHALEHGTIELLHRRYGTTRGIGGRALANGFRVFGVRDPEDIRSAFDELMALPHEERWSLVVSRRCGSMLVVTQGLAVILLLLTLGAFSLWRPDPFICGGVLAVQLFLFAVLRGPVGLRLQRRRLLSLDFSHARVLSITKVRSEPPLEVSPVYLVRTVVGGEA